MVVHAAVEPATLLAAIAETLPNALVIGSGRQLAVLKGVGHPDRLAASFGLASVQGWQAVAHTRMATESAVTAAGSHPFSVGADQCLVHNGSFSNHATIRRELSAAGVRFDSENDSEVGARYVAQRLLEGCDLEKALRLLCENFDGFYTLVVTTGDSFAVVRDAIACKPADHRRNRPVGRDGLRVPRAGHVAGHRERPDLRTRTRGGLPVAPLTETGTVVDLSTTTIRELNQSLHARGVELGIRPGACCTRAVGTASPAVSTPSCPSTSRATSGTTARA